MPFSTHFATRRRFRRRSWRPRFVAAMVVLLVVLQQWLRWSAVGDTETTVESLASGQYDVRRVIDGGNIVLAASHDESQRARLRLLGLSFDLQTENAVELQHRAHQLCETLIGQQVTLRLDRRRLDTDGVFLGYVFSGEQFVNAELVRAGLARVDVRPSDSSTMVRLLRQAESEARVAGRGTWHDVARQPATTASSTMAEMTNVWHTVRHSEQGSFAER